MARLVHLVFCFLLLVSMAAAEFIPPRFAYFEKHEAKQASTVPNGLHVKNGQKDPKFGPGSWEFVYGK
uniref:Uncharacterized protein n=1 Tax=Steinernema glaseri TaxID=37863 RepID=A0A1I7Z354_9BILA